MISITLKSGYTIMAHSFQIVDNCGETSMQIHEITSPGCSGEVWSYYPLDQLHTVCGLMQIVEHKQPEVCNVDCCDAPEPPSDRFDVVGRNHEYDTYVAYVAEANAHERPYLTWGNWLKGE